MIALAKEFKEWYLAQPDKKAITTEALKFVAKRKLVSLEEAKTPEGQITAVNLWWLDQRKNKQQEQKAQ